MAIAKVVALVAAGALILPGCTEAQRFGEPATSVAECKSKWQAESRAAGQGLIATGNLGAAIVTGLISAAKITEAKAAADARLSTCLARFGVTDMEAFLAADDTSGFGGTPVAVVPAAPPARSGFDRPSAATVAPRSPGCPANASVLYGGTTYCTGR